MKTTNERKIVFDLSNVSEEILQSVGVYKILNKINGHFYIGSCDRNFKERFIEHCRYYEMYKEGTRNNMHPKLWAAYDKYGIENFSVEIIEILDGKTDKEILVREEFFIHELKPDYNISLYPTCGGKPNLGKKLTEDLINKGCVPNKSLILKFPTSDIVPDNLIFHFMRGYFDGDGWIGFDSKKTFHRTNITGTKNFIIGYCNKLNIHNIENRLRKKGNVYQFEFHKQESNKMLDLFYSNCTIYLDRKYDRYLFKNI